MTTWIACVALLLSACGSHRPPTQASAEASVSSEPGLNARVGSYQVGRIQGNVLKVVPVTAEYLAIQFEIRAPASSPAARYELMPRVEVRTPTVSQDGRTIG